MGSNCIIFFKKIGEISIIKKINTHSNFYQRTNKKAKI